jgi:hypothetical protein
MLIYVQPLGWINGGGFLSSRVAIGYSRRTQLFVVDLITAVVFGEPYKLKFYQHSARSRPYCERPSSAHVENNYN